MKNNISIIGMAGVGKSFLSKHLALELGYEYVSVDDIITEMAKKVGTDKNLLPDERFKPLEEAATISLKDKKRSVLDTGGSVIYSPRAMKVLKNISLVIYLADSLENIERRFKERGEFHLIGMLPEMTFDDLFSERRKLYEKYADVKIDVSKHPEIETLVKRVIDIYHKQ